MLLPFRIASLFCLIDLKHFVLADCRPFKPKHVDLWLKNDTIKIQFLKKKKNRRKHRMIRSLKYRDVV